MAEEQSTGDGEAADLHGMPFADDEMPDEELKWPIGFIVVLVLAALYLGWRLIQLLGGVIDLIG